MESNTHHQQTSQPQSLPINRTNTNVIPSYTIRCCKCNTPTTTIYNNKQSRYFRYYCISYSNYKIRGNMSTLYELFCENCPKKWKSFDGSIQQYQ